MKFALLGTDEESLPLALAAVEAGHEIVWSGDDAAARSGRELPWLCAEDLAGQWEALLDHRTCSAVIVGRGDIAPAVRAEQVIQLVKNGVAVLTTYPLVESVLSYYEIDMVRCESNAVLHHFNPLVQQHALIEEIAHWVSEGHPELGRVEQISWHRPLVDRTREQALWHFARDVELLGDVAGRLNRLGAHGSPDEEATYAGLSVQLLGKSKIPVRWEVGPKEQGAWPRMVLVAANGMLSWELNDTAETLQIELNQAGKSKIQSVVAVDVFATAIDRFVSAMELREAGRSTWPAALHAMELTDTIEISLRRGRMIDVHDQQLTEQMAFKGTMSALGCGLLMVLPPVLIAAGWFAEKAGLPFANYWAHALLALLAVFLAFQLLPRLLLNPTASEQEERGD